MAKRNRDEKNPTSTEEQQREPIKIGPITIPAYVWDWVIEKLKALSKRQLWLLIIGFIAGISLALYSVIQFQQPSFLVDPMIATAVSAAATKTAQAVTPTPTSMPSPLLKIFDTSTGQSVLPEQGEYKLNPGQTVEIRFEPAHGNKIYRWTSYPETEDGFRPKRPTESRVTFRVSEKQDQLILIAVCELDESLSCPGGMERTILIRSILSER